MHLLSSPEKYKKLIANIKELPPRERVAVCRDLAMNDLYFLLRYGLGRKDANNPFIFRMCREVQADPYDVLNLWARNHYKSTIISFAFVIKRILEEHANKRHYTVGLFSHTRALAQSFLISIKREFEQNDALKEWFPDVLYDNPVKQSPLWSVQDGIIVKRFNNPKEATVEAWGVVEGQPVGKHFTDLVFDDVVVPSSVTTPAQIAKTTEMLQMAFNLGSRGTRKLWAGTRYHFADTYGHLIEKTGLRTRVVPATEDGKPEGNPVFLSKKEIEEKYRDMGTHVFNCFPKGSPVLMADWTEKDISEIKVGDYVVGYSFNEGKRAKLVRSKVISTKCREDDIFEYTLSSGRKVRCTKDHKWYTGRRGKDVGGTDHHRTYVPLGFGQFDAKALVNVYDPRILQRQYDPYICGWLAGMFDGEGSISGGCIHIHQSGTHNPLICEEIGNAFTALGFDYGLHKVHTTSVVNKKEGIGFDFYLRGGREEKIRFINLVKPKKKEKIIDFLFAQGTREFGMACRDPLVAAEYAGKEPVYNIQTETGNYVCHGYATKNCQMLLSPVPDEQQEFKPEWWREYYGEFDSRYKAGTRYLLIDPSSGKKSREGKANNNDYTVIIAIECREDDNIYVLKMLRQRLNLVQRTEALFDFHAEFKPERLHGVRYEDVGMQADIEHIKEEMKRRRYMFDITPMPAQMPKNDRIRRLVPYFQFGRIIMPETINCLDDNKKPINLVEVFKKEEYLTFPFSKHDDMMDALSRLAEEKYPLEFPKSNPSQYIEDFSIGRSGVSDDGFAY